MYGYQQTSAPSNAPQELMQWFQAVDQDRSGRITANELRQALAAGDGSNFSLEACEQLIKLYDRDNSKTIDFQGFQQLFHFINQWRAAFAAYDRDKSCSIDANELGLALQQMGYRLSQKTVDALINRFSTSKKGQISFDNFIIACTRLHQLTDAFRQHDKQQIGVVSMAYEDFLKAALSGI